MYNIVTEQIFKCYTPMGFKEPLGLLRELLIYIANYLENDLLVLELRILKDKIVNISVRDLVEFVLRQGNLDSTYISAKRMQEGVKIHNKIQKKRKKECLHKGTVYEKEVQLKHSFEYLDFIFNVEGRADGIIIEESQVSIEEIKSTTKNLNEIEENKNHRHWAQAKSYGYIYCVNNKINEIKIIITYVDVQTCNELSFDSIYTVEELKEFFEDLTKRYYKFAKLDYDRIELRNETGKKLVFPYDNFRQNQRNLMATVYKTIRESKKLFVQAPTGTGKTIVALFPTIKALSEGLADKIFYLTAKTITGQIAENTLALMDEYGLKMRSITLVSKEKICFEKGSACNPNQCQYALGHFDRVNDAIFDVTLNATNIKREQIEQYAKKHKVCPYELSLDVTLFSDIIVCDYNYVYDPKVSLKRFFGENIKKRYVLLNDEAHNLVDRARDMFSAEITIKDVLQTKLTFKRNKNIYNILSEIENTLLIINTDILYEPIEELTLLAQNFVTQIDSWLVTNQSSPHFDNTLQFYFKILDYLRTCEFFDERFVVYIEREKFNIQVKLLCLDPSFLLGVTQKKVSSTIFFSATLAPISYFKNLLGGENDDLAIKVSSPYDPSNLCILIDGKISTKYKDRVSSYDKIVDNLFAMLQNKRGNYFVFFSSYEYMNKVYEIFADKYPLTKTVMQNKEMTQEQKESFLNEFSEDNEETLLGFVVLGGMFSEGIDLKGERLIGVAIVGVGLPMITRERNIIADYYKAKNNFGFEYAYMYPGMNKVLQAAGRVIRSEKDKGVVLLMDTRFLNSHYINLFPDEWSHFKVIEKNIPYAEEFNLKNL